MNYVISEVKKTAKLARKINTGKFDCTVSVFKMSIVIVVRLFRSFLFCPMFSASSSYSMHGNRFIACHNFTPNRTAYPKKLNMAYGQICHAKFIMQLIAMPFNF